MASRAASRSATIAVGHQLGQHLDTLACRCDLADGLVDVVLPQAAGPRRCLLRARSWLLFLTHEKRTIS